MSSEGKQNKKASGYSLAFLFFLVNYRAIFDLYYDEYQLKLYMKD